MKRFSVSRATATSMAAVFWLSCFGGVGCTREYLDRQDERLFERYERRKSWSDRMDQRYDRWWDSVMGR